MTRSTPFIVGGLLNRLNSLMNPIIKDLENVSSSIKYVSPKGLSTFDGTHFDAPSLRQLGKRYANTLV